MIPAETTIACNEGLLEELEIPNPDDWFDSHPCGVGRVVWATVMAYKDPTYPDAKPSAVADFWDFDRFPGKRGLRKVAEVNLEWALIADSVAVQDVYEVLGTEEGVDRAFAKLDQVKEGSVWWEAGAQAPQILVDGEAAISSAYNGRVYNAYKNESQPLSIMWDTQVWDIGYMTVAKGAPNAEAAKEFLLGAYSSPEYQGRITYTSRTARCSSRPPHSSTLKCRGICRQITSTSTRSITTTCSGRTTGTSCRSASPPGSRSRS